MDYIKLSIEEINRIWDSTNNCIRPNARQSQIYMVEDLLENIEPGAEKDLINEIVARIKDEFEIYQKDVEERSSEREFEREFSPEYEEEKPIIADDDFLVAEGEEELATPEDEIAIEEEISQPVGKRKKSKRKDNQASGEKGAVGAESEQYGSGSDYYNRYDTNNQNQNQYNNVANNNYEGQAGASTRSEYSNGSGASEYGYGSGGYTLNGKYYPSGVLPSNQQNYSVQQDVVNYSGQDQFPGQYNSVVSTSIDNQVKDTVQQGSSKYTIEIQKLAEDLKQRALEREKRYEMSSQYKSTANSYTAEKYSTIYATAASASNVSYATAYAAGASSPSSYQQIIASKITAGRYATATMNADNTASSYRSANTTPMVAYSQYNNSNTVINSNQGYYDNETQRRSTSKNGYAVAQALAMPGMAVMNTYQNMIIGGIDSAGQVKSGVSTAAGFAVGGVALVGGVASIASGTFGNVKQKISDSSKNFLFGKEYNVAGTTIKVSRNYASFSSSGAIKRYNSFLKNNKSLVSEFTTKKGRFNEKKLDTELSALLEKYHAGTATESEIRRLGKLSDYKGLRASATRANNIKSDLKKVGKGISRVGGAAVSLMSSLDPADAQSLQFGYTSIRLLVKTAKVGVKAGRVVVKGTKLVAKKTAGTIAKTKVGKNLTIAKKTASNSIKASVPSVKTTIKSTKAVSSVRKIGQKTLKTVQKSANKVASKVAKKTTTKIAKKIQRAVKKVADTVKKVVDVGTDFVPVLGQIKTIIKIVIAVALLAVILFIMIGSIVIGSQYIFGTTDSVLQEYIDYAVEIADDFREGELYNSVIEVWSQEEYDEWVESGYLVFTDAAEDAVLQRAYDEVESASVAIYVAQKAVDTAQKTYDKLKEKSDELLEKYFSANADGSTVATTQADLVAAITATEEAYETLEEAEIELSEAQDAYDAALAAYVLLGGSEDDFTAEMSDEEYEELINSTYEGEEGVQDGENLADIYNTAGAETGRWRIVTTTYLDEDGNETDATDNIKEIISMVAVKINQMWLGTDYDDDEEDDDTNDDEYVLYEDEEELVEEYEEVGVITSSDIKAMIKYLYIATHDIKVVQSDAYTYTKEVNNVAVSYSVNGVSDKKVVTGDAEGEGCQTDTFYCTDDYNEAVKSGIASEYKLLLLSSDYNVQGGCEIDYEGVGTYYADTDTFVIDTETATGTTTYENAHEQSWATDEMVELYELSQENGGDGDEMEGYAHEDNVGSPAEGCEDYTKSIKHSDSTNTPADGCSDYSYVLPTNTKRIVASSYETSLPTSFTASWDDLLGKYIYYINGTEYSREMEYTTDTIKYYLAEDGMYYPAGTVFTCNEIVYTCNEGTYTCTGHEVEVTIYYCPGHTEWYCDGNHYDLDVYITVAHTYDDSIYYADVANDYDYKRKALAVSEYPDDYDLLEDDGVSTDFYWSESNMEWCEDLYSGDWEELYGVYGLEDTNQTLDEDNISTYLAYLDVEHVYSWEEQTDYYDPDEDEDVIHMIPYDENDVVYYFSGTQWFYDEVAGNYVQLKSEYITNKYGFSSRLFTELQRSDENPLGLTDERIELVTIALNLVGYVSYSEGGRPNDFSFLYDEDGTIIGDTGLDSGGFVNYVLNEAGLGFTTSNSIRSIWNNTYSIDGTEDYVYYGNGNLDDLSTVDWSEYEDASELRQYIVDLAIGYCGKIPYVWGGSSLTTGVDCSGFVAQIYASVGILSQSAADSHAYVSSTFRTLGYAVSQEDVQPGDILCYEGHVAIYVDSTHIVHAKGTDYGLVVEECNPFTYHGGVITIRSLITDENEHLAAETETLSYSTSTLSVGTTLSGNALTIYEWFVENGDLVTDMEYDTGDIVSFELENTSLAGILGWVYANTKMVANYVDGDIDGLSATEYTEAVEDGTISKSEFIKDGVVYGLFCFDGEMKEYLYDATVGSDKNLDDVEAQCEAIYNYLSDLKGNWRTVGSALNDADDAGDAASVWKSYFSYFNTTSSSMQSYASQYYLLITGKSSIGGYEDDLLPGDLVFINSYYNRESDDIPYNQVGIYLGTNELGQMLVICCNNAMDGACVITSSAFIYARRLECW